MKLTVVFPSRLIQKDEEVYILEPEEWTIPPGNIHAIKWDSEKGKGFIEYIDSSLPVSYFTDASVVSYYNDFYDNYHASQQSYESINQDFYDVGALDPVTNTYASIPRDLETVKTETVARVKRQANTLLQQTDWYVIRYYELGPSNAEGMVPAAVSAYRAQIRSASHAACQAILAASNLDAVIALPEPAFPAEIDSDLYYLREY